MNKGWKESFSALGAAIVLGLLIACKNRVDEVLAERAKAQQVDTPVQSRRVRVTGVIE